MISDAEQSALKSDDVYTRSNPVLPHANRLEFQLDQINVIRKKSYGKWYLKPQHFNKRIESVNDKLLKASKIN